MIRHQLTWKQARECARDFVRAVTDPPRQWTAITAEGFLPAGWRFRYDATDAQFMPLNIENAANAFRQIAVRDRANRPLDEKRKRILGAAFMRAQRSRR